MSKRPAGLPVPTVTLYTGSDAVKARSTILQILTNSIADTVAPAPHPRSNVRTFEYYDESLADMLRLVVYVYRGMSTAHYLVVSIPTELDAPSTTTRLISIGQADSIETALLYGYISAHNAFEEACSRLVRAVFPEGAPANLGSSGGTGGDVIPKKRSGKKKEKSKKK